MEKTVVVTLGGKEYLATQLTDAEQCEVARMMPAVKASDFPENTAALLEVLEVICASIRRTGSDITVEEVTKQWTVFAAVGVLEAVNTLLQFTVMNELPGGATIQ